LTGKLPPWFTKKIPDPLVISEIKRLREEMKVHTICESALCPNAGECSSRKTATFLILRDVCTRRCTFCAVNKGVPAIVDEREPQHLFEAVQRQSNRSTIFWEYFSLDKSFCFHK